MYVCNDCGHKFETPFSKGYLNRCPQCKTLNIGKMQEEDEDEEPEE